MCNLTVQNWTVFISLYLYRSLYRYRVREPIYNICPQGVVCPCPGAIYMYKSIKIYTRTRCQMSIYRTTGPLVCMYQRQIFGNVKLYSKFSEQIVNSSFLFTYTITCISKHSLNLIQKHSEYFLKSGILIAFIFTVHVIFRLF